MKIIITDIDSGEEKIIRLSAPREEQFMGDQSIIGLREFAIDFVTLEALRVLESDQEDSLHFILTPTSPQIDLRRHLRRHHRSGCITPPQY